MRAPEIHLFRLNQFVELMKILPILLTLLAANGLLLSACNNSAPTGNTPAAPTPTETPKTPPTTPMETQTTPPTPAAIAQNLTNMQAAYKGEMTATAKYAAYSKQAATEKLPQLALLYKAISAAETIHAGNHKAVLAEAGQPVPVIKPEYKVKTTREHLQDDIEGEAYEAATMYPNFLQAAAAAHNDQATISLTYAQKTEKRHEGMYARALAALDGHTLATLPTAYFICPTCGNTYENKAPDRCGISLTKGAQFAKISTL